jgi:hypothetical protein
MLSHVLPHLHHQQEHRVTANVSEAPASRFLQVSHDLPVCHEITPEDVSFTLVTQCSDDRLWMMEHHCQRWAVDNNKPYLSIVVYTNQPLPRIKAQLVDYNCPVDNGLTVQTLPKTLADEDYPVNTLRNMAFKEVATTHAVYVDIDFWTSTDLFAILNHSPVVRETLAASTRHALILPAFQLRRQCKPWKECPSRNIPLMPKVKSDMVPFFTNRTVTAFDPTNFGGHGSTRYVDWLDQTQEELLEISCVKSNRYEPYVVIRTCRDLVPFQPRFTGYGKNKMTWFMQLRRMGWQFYQLGEAFVIHYPHLDSKARLAWNGGAHGEHLRKPEDPSQLAMYKRGKNDETFVQFREWLYETLPDQTKVALCEKHQDDDSRLWVNRPGKKGEVDDEGSEDEEIADEQ